jgi:sigma-B regulation protein RsbU (phosphoserine phosphatase)
MGTPKSYAFADINRRLVRNLAGLALVAILAVIAATLGGRFILRRVDALVAGTRKLAAGEFRTRVPEWGCKSELDLLAPSFNSMAATLQERERALRAAEEKTRKAEVELAVTRAHMDIAKQIQRSLLPEDPLACGCVQYAGRCIPAGAVGGDYFGYFPRGAGGVDSLIGDVSGHGVGAALIMAEARTMFMAERLAAPSAAELLRKLNGLLHDDLECAGYFITACCAIFDAPTRTLSYANAGHPPPLLLRESATQCTALDADGMLLGIEKDVTFADMKVKLATGDIVVFYTDGITETQNREGEMFGVGRLGDAVAAHRGDEPEAMVSNVLGTLERFGGGGEHEDDLTLVVMKLTG